MKGASAPQWQPHKWVIEAMRAAVKIRNAEAEKQLRNELAKAKAEIYTLTSLMRR
ncbi:hypothetical protein D3C80_2240270 [compost metagenome]